MWFVFSVLCAFDFGYVTFHVFFAKKDDHGRASKKKKKPLPNCQKKEKIN